MSNLPVKILGWFLGCAVVAASAADFPPLCPAGTPAEYFPGKFVWAELFTTEPAAVQGFYTGVFGWEVTNVERTTTKGTHTYLVMTNGGDPVAGIVRRPTRRAGEVDGRWVGFVSVPDVGAAVAAGTGAGGRVLFPPRDLPQRGTQAVLVDPEGGELGLIHSSSGDPGEYAPDAGDFAWAQLLARKPEAESKFCSAVAGWEILPDTRGNRPDVFVVASGGYSRGSVAPVPARPDAKPGWLLMIRVLDVNAAVAKAVALGGRVLVAPSEKPTEHWRAVVADPAGAVIGLVQLQNPGLKKEQP